MDIDHHMSIHPHTGTYRSTYAFYTHACTCTYVSKMVLFKVSWWDALCLRNAGGWYSEKRFWYRTIHTHTNVYCRDMSTIPRGVWHLLLFYMSSSYYTFSCVRMIRVFEYWCVFRCVHIEGEWHAHMLVILSCDVYASTSTLYKHPTLIDTYERR
jgi:hypothetical protein